MTLEQIIVIILVGAAAGWLGGYFYKGEGLGAIGNIIVGILGSFVGSWLLRELKINIGASPLVNAVLTGGIGAFVILLFVGMFTGGKFK